MKKQNYRHGDVMLVRVDKKMEKEIRAAAGAYQRDLTIPLGEATGHHHTLYPAQPDASAVRLIEINGRRFIDVGAEYFLRHQEHKEHRIDPGCYEITMEDECCPFEKQMRKVVD